MSRRIAVVTPYFEESAEVLRQCHQSVLDQEGIDADHLMIADGRPLAEIDGWKVRHIKLPAAHGDNGNTPRGLGGLLAKAEGYDFVAYLDADNWYHPGHLASLLALHEQSGAAICSAFRTFHGPAGEPLNLTEGDEDALRHVDTSAYLIHRARFDLLAVWLDMPRILSPICDRVFLAAILHRGHAVQSSGQRTVAFRSRYAVHYRDAGRPIPEDARPADYGAGVVEYLRTPEGVSECVRALGFWPGSYMPFG